MAHISLKEVESKLGAIFINIYKSTTVLNIDTARAMAHKAICLSMDIIAMIDGYINSIEPEKPKPIEIPIEIVKEIEIIIESK